MAFPANDNFGEGEPEMQGTFVGVQGGENEELTVGAPSVSPAAEDCFPALGPFDPSQAWDDEGCWDSELKLDEEEDQVWSSDW
mmetsp:Transcript_35347/g.79209  ORF Transcript_35347/g.79209 Transcript_35347/m.79209 type:complete len:83 (+) Transcript_35347:268-516(+)